MLCQETTETDTVLNKDPENKEPYQEATEITTTLNADHGHEYEEKFWDDYETVTGEKDWIQPNMEKMDETSIILTSQK